MKQEPGRQQPGISGLQAGEDVKGEKFCSGCRRYRPAEQIASTRVVIHRTGKATRYLCVTCAETIRARTEKKAVA